MEQTIRARGVATATVVGSLIAAVAFTGPASATDLINDNAVGSYNYAYKEKKAVWVVTPCDDELPKCVKVSQFSTKDKAHEKPNWTGTATWVVGSWIMVVDIPGQVTCEDGTKFTLPVTYSWDAATNQGMRSYLNPGLCPDSEPIDTGSPFTLEKIGPPPA